MVEKVDAEAAVDAALVADATAVAANHTEPTHLQRTLFF